MKERRAFLTWFVLCLAVLAGLSLATAQGVPQMVFNAFCRGSLW